MWLVYDSETGAELRREATEPQAIVGEGFERMPGSALAEPPISVWNAGMRGFVDVPLVDGPMLRRLLTPAEIAAACANPATIPIVLQWNLLLHAGEPQRVNSPLHIAGANALLAGGVLTTARHAEFLAGVPPTIGGNQ